MKKNITVLLTVVAALLLTLPSCKKETTQAVAFDCTTLSYITTNTTIPAGIYNISCNIEVANNAILTVAPGTTLVFGQGFAVTVDAGSSISAIGTSGNPIVFKGAQAIKGYWNGIFINSISLANQFTYCTISDGGASVGNKFGANVNLTGGTAGFNNCTVSNSADAGFYLFGLSLSAQYVDVSVFNSFQNNTLSGNATFPIVTFAAGAGSIGTGNVFTGHAANYNYVAIRSESDVNVNVTLSPLAIPYLVLQLGGDAGVSFDKIFTVRPGTTIVMGSATSLYVAATGTFVAVGTSSSPIIFKGFNATAGYWGTLAIQSPNANDFEYCTVSDGGGTSSYDIYSNNKGMIGTYMYIDIPRTITVKHCILSNSGSAGVWVSAADGAPNIAPTFNSDVTTSNTFTNCTPPVQM